MATAHLVLNFALLTQPSIPLLSSSLEPSLSYRAALSHSKLGWEGIANGRISAGNLHADLVYSGLSMAEPRAIGEVFPLGPSHRIRIIAE